ncbi:NYN domain-containing protein [Candidatus Pacearchaeota archaeon]|nr:NYN domain-containing protein [Candidatus Pacearchaeota archaeon]
MKNQDRRIDYHKLNKFVINYLSKIPQYKNKTLFHVRTYYYDGEYTDTLINKIKKHHEDIKKTSGSDDDKAIVQEILTKAERRLGAQKKEIFRMSSFPFFETRLKPLQYSKKNGIFQKGVDVQLAVDLVSNAYLDNYDVAVLFSGDIDLYESVKLVKTLGKHVIVFSHNSLMARGMTKVCDYYKDLHWLDNAQLDEFTHIFQHRPNNTGARALVS